MHPSKIRIKIQIFLVPYMHPSKIHIKKYKYFFCTIAPGAHPWQNLSESKLLWPIKGVMLVQWYGGMVGPGNGFIVHIIGGHISRSRVKHCLINAHNSHGVMHGTCTQKIKNLVSRRW